MDGLFDIYVLIIVAVLWSAFGAYFFRDILRLKSPRELGFNLDAREVGLSLIMFSLAYVFLASVVAQFFVKRGTDPIYASVVATFIMQCCMISLCFGAAEFFNSKPKFWARFIDFRRPFVSFCLPFLRGAVAMISVFALIYIISLLWKFLLLGLGFDAESQDFVGIFLAVHTPIYRTLMIVSLVLLAPLWEELFFRVGIYGALKGRFGFLPAALASSVIFGLIHTSLLAFLPIAVLGFFFVVLYEKYGDIRVSVGAHSVFNFINMMLLIYEPEMSDI